MDWHGIQKEFRELWHAIILWNIAFSNPHIEDLCERHDI